MKIRAPKFDKTAISPYNRYCDGYSRPGSMGNGYVSVVKVVTGTVEKTDDFLLDGIVAYDRAEANDAYIGQINMETPRKNSDKTGQTENQSPSVFLPIFLYPCINWGRKQSPQSVDYNP